MRELQPYIEHMTRDPYREFSVEEVPAWQAPKSGANVLDPIDWTPNHIEYPIQHNMGKVRVNMAELGSALTMTLPMLPARELAHAYAKAYLGASWGESNGLLLNGKISLARLQRAEDSLQCICGEFQVQLTSSKSVDLSHTT